jgi:hypothetical protein
MLLFETDPKTFILQKMPGKSMIERVIQNFCVLGSVSVIKQNKKWCVLTDEIER